MTTLLAHIDSLIRKRGPISVADYMELALQHPEFGYYKKGDPFGAEGDFVTAPEISQMFGEMIGLWCADVWRQMGKPEKFALLELGPGRGTLMQDALRATEKIHGFHKAMELCLVESNETLRKMQQEKLAAHNPRYIEDVNALPHLPVLAIANEFFDALPIRQFEKTFQGWCEKLVTIENNRLGFVTQPLDPAVAFLIPKDLQEALPGTVHEISLTSLAIMRDLSRHVVTRGGAALIIDYGYVAPSGKPTLQAVAEHAPADVLEKPGEADVTAHVDFAALKNTAAANGAMVMPPVGQGEFLQTLGIELRADQLKLAATPEQKRAIHDALRRLTDAGEMGSLFKAMAVAPPQLDNLPGF
jgi:NADH dehydrogenase [ubiquinone] 1 alpha subcomplex assembly factor 7